MLSCIMNIQKLDLFTYILLYCNSLTRCEDVVRGISCLFLQQRERVDAPEAMIHFKLIDGINSFEYDINLRIALKKKVTIAPSKYELLILIFI
uniref:Uncharacterized protein n=1 Tax=Trichogramma kaykai TaxID=54128 RepID=A0ABD2XB13_9HYME